MLLNYPICLVYHPSTRQLTCIYAPDLNIQFFAGEPIANVPLPRLLTDLRQRMRLHLAALQADGIQFNLPSDIKDHEVPGMDAQHLWLMLDVTLDYRPGLAERALWRGSQVYTLAALALMAVNILFASQITFRRAGPIGSLLLGLVSAVTGFILGQLFVRFAGVTENAAALGRRLDNAFRAAPTRQRIGRSVRRLPGEPAALALLADVAMPETGEAQELQPILTDEVITLGASLLDDPDESPKSPAASSPVQRKSHLGIAALKAGSFIGITGVLALDMAIQSLNCYQTSYHIGINAFDKKIPPWVIKGISGVGTAFLFLQFSFTGGSIILKLVKDIEKYLQQRYLHQQDRLSTLSAARFSDEENIVAAPHANSRSIFAERARLFSRRPLVTRDAAPEALDTPTLTLR